MVEVLVRYLCCRVALALYTYLFVFVEGALVGAYSYFVAFELELEPFLDSSDFED